MANKVYSPEFKAEVVSMYKEVVRRPDILVKPNPLVAAHKEVNSSLGEGKLKWATLSTWVMSADYDDRGDVAYELKRLRRNK